MHFRNYAPEKIAYAVNRYAFEAGRHFGIINTRLGKNKYMLGDTYTIVDMNIWGWARAQRAVALKDKHKFKTEMDQEALDAMFPHMKQKVA